MAESDMEFARAALAQRRASFLPLVPAVSGSFPPAAAREQQQERPSIPHALPDRSRRTPTGFKVLRLGPVHSGVHSDGHQSDFHHVEEDPSVTTVQGQGSSRSGEQGTFLSLAPTVSASYPEKPRASPPAEEAMQSSHVESPSRRSSASSISSEASPDGMRVLKLGPVYWGKHADDHNADYYDVIPTSP